MGNDRLELLKQWINSVLETNDYAIEPASGDASFRRYFRVKLPDKSYIAMDAPPKQEALEPFMSIASHLKQAGLNVPQIYHYDIEKGLMLLSDLGDKQYLDHLNQQTVESLYSDSLDALFLMQQTPQPNDLPLYSAALLDNEMLLFKDWFLEKHLAIELNKQQTQILETSFAMLRDAALKQPQVFVHRDYHSRNLMLTTKFNPGILDFQDAVLGPITYDLVSLLRDCYITWTDTQLKSWIDSYYKRLISVNMIDTDRQTFQQWFDWMGMQRHLKAIGIFARLNHRDGKPGYLQDIPRTFNYIDKLCDNYTELNAFGELMQELKISEQLN